ncbi:MAG TPA: response regulator, partial [Rhodospirillales bacterium]|nr:response regulator [Rhodospirillales bacterium]
MAYKILIADNDAATLQILENALGEIATVVSAASGAEAITKASSDSPDLILLGVDMPGMDGYEVCKKLKRNARTKKIPLLLLCEEPEGAKGLKLEILGLELGALGYVAKPIQPQVVKAKVNSLLQHLSTPSAPTDPQPTPPPPPPTPPPGPPVSGRSRMIIEDDDDEPSRAGGGIFMGFFKFAALIVLLF